MKDSKNNLDIVSSHIPKVYSTNQVENGTGVDLQGFDSSVVTLITGTISDGSYAPKVQESDDDLTYTDVSVQDIEGTLNALSANDVQRVGYKGNKRFIRSVVTVTGATSGGAFTSMVIRSVPHIAPAA